MYQPQHHTQHQQQASTAVQPAAAGQPLIISVHSPTVFYQTYKSRESVAAGVILIIAGAFSIVVNAVGIYREHCTEISHGIWCGTMVS